MKGTVVSSWIITSRRLYGDAVVEAALTKFGFSSNQIFSPLEDVPDNAAVGLLEDIGSRAGKKKGEIWSVMGRENIKTFAQNYPGFFRQESAFQFLKSMNDVHKIVMRRIKGATPPILDMTVISSKEAMFIYRSNRGMHEYLRGLLKGVSEHFGEKIEVKIEKITASEAHFRLIFEKEISYTKKYFLNKLFSFGFIKNSGIKAALMSGIIMAFLMLFLFGADIRAIVAILAFPLAAVGSNLLISSPLKEIEREISQLSSRMFAAKLKIDSNDEYEEMMKSLHEAKGVVQKDFIGFNSTADEMYNFNSSLSGISKKMMDTSDDILDTIELVAKATNMQAVNTEQIVASLNESITSIGVISDESSSNNERIVNALGDLQKTFSEVKVTSDRILVVMEKFDEIRRDGNDLQNDAEKIMQVVSIVAGIASQINLLALNASIEAARVGEAGKGFAVVADEVRKLSVETNQAVDKINGELGGFIGKINSLVDDIDRQYGVLEEGSSSLDSAVKTSDVSNENLQDVSRLMSSTMGRLESETKNITKLFDPVQNLAAIAEENSASTQEASDSVSQYVEQITELSRQISVFSSLIEEFKADLAGYKI